jgi:hypothetical protein
MGLQPSLPLNACRCFSLAAQVPVSNRVAAKIARVAVKLMENLLRRMSNPFLPQLSSGAKPPLRRCCQKVTRKLKNAPVGPDDFTPRNGYRLSQMM